VRVALVGLDQPALLLTEYKGVVQFLVILPMQLRLLVVEEEVLFLLLMAAVEVLAVEARELAQLHLVLEQAAQEIHLP
jgi:hypothetical protein